VEAVNFLEVLGAGGHGQDVAEIARACGYDPLFYDDDESLGHPPTALRPQRFPYVVGVNEPATRRRLAVGLLPVTLVHPTATVADSASIQSGCVVGAGTHIGPGCLVGRHVHIGPGCTLTRTEVGGFTTISPGVDIAGDVFIGPDVLVGVGARISNLISIGVGARVGAGAVVVRDVAAGETVVTRSLTATGDNK
jgi:acetyltransferase-like isoleucine patch superfamily enzyme